jgi:type IV pilus assembly protein PilC
MSLYTYRAINPLGRTSKGVQEATNLADLEFRLKRSGLDLIAAKVQAHASLRNTIKRADLITFFFNMEQLTGAGVPLLDCLTDLRDSMDETRLRGIIGNLIESIESGKTLALAMQQHPLAFDTVFVSLIHAGEQSGRLTEVFAHLTESLKWQDEMSAHTRSILLYPTFVGAIVLTITFFLMTYLVPQLLGFIKAMGQEIPLQTRLLLATSQIFVQYGYVILALPVAIFVTAKLLMRTDASLRLKFDDYKLKIWIVGPILRKIILARFANSFAMMYRSGISILDCLAYSRGLLNNLAMSKSLDEVIRDIESGQNLTQSFQHTQMFPPLVIRMLKVGETTGALDAALLNVSYFYDREVRASIKKIQIMVEPAMTILLGLLLGWVMLSVLSPIYDLIAKVKF